MDEAEDCIICTSPLDEKPWTSMSSVCCNAKIHRICLEKNIMLNQRSCPFCRKELTKDDLNKLSLDVPKNALKCIMEPELFQNVPGEDLILLGEAIITYGNALVELNDDDPNFTQELHQLSNAIDNFAEILLDSDEETIADETNPGILLESEAETGADETNPATLLDSDVETSADETNSEPILDSEAETSADETNFNSDVVPLGPFGDNIQDPVPDQVERALNCFQEHFLTPFLDQMDQLPTEESTNLEDQLCIPSSRWFCYFHRNKLSDCARYLQSSTASRRLILNFGCLICTSTIHTTPFCNSNRNCQNCQSGSHHETICDTN